MLCRGFKQISLTYPNFFYPETSNEEISEALVDGASFISFEVDVDKATAFIEETALSTEEHQLAPDDIARLLDFSIRALKVLNEKFSRDLPSTSMLTFLEKVSTKLSPTDRTATLNIAVKHFPSLLSKFR
jgi:hypothetical protein